MTLFLFFFYIHVWATITILCVADGRIDSTGKRKGSPCEQDGDIDSQAGKIMRSIPELPEVPKH